MTVQQAPGNKAAVIVPVHNDARTLKLSLESILPSIREHGWQLIVVDDLSPDNSSEIAEHFGARVIRLKENRGVAGARNAGADATDANILVFVDADIVVAPETLPKLVNALEEESDTHSVGAYPLPEDLSPEWSAHFVGLRSGWGFQWKEGEVKRPFYPLQSECGAIRRSVFQELGGFPEEFGKVGMEEYKLGHELERRGYGCFLLKSASYKHHYKTLIRRSLILFERTMHWAALLLQRKKFESPGAVGTENAALSCILTFAGLFFLMSGIFINWLWGVAAFLWFCQLMIERGFLSFARRIYGWPMVFFAIPALQVMHLSIGLGFIWGIIRLFFRTGNR